MEEKDNVSEREFVQQLYDYSANLLFEEKKETSEVERILVDKGLNESDAKIIIMNLQSQYQEAKKEKANKDMLYGALWCVGGTIATITDIGFIFWGAIVFGAIQFFQGLIHSSK